MLGVYWEIIRVLTPESGILFSKTIQSDESNPIYIFDQNIEIQQDRFKMVQDLNVVQIKFLIHNFSGTLTWVCSRFVNR